MSSFGIWPSESNYAKEARKWDLPKSQGGMRPDTPQEYPRMVYKAQTDPTSGRMEVNIPEDVMMPDGRSVRMYAHQFNTRCQKLVNSDFELDKAHKDGWRKTQAEAMAYVRGLEAAVAEAAAFRNYEDRNASEPAKREIAAAEAATHKNFGEIPEQPKAKRKYTRRAKPEPGV